MLAGLSLLLLSACTAESTGAGGSASATAEPTGQTVVQPSGAGEPSGPTVADSFTPPRPAPGPPWTKDGRPADSRVLNSVAGPSHCNWQNLVFLHLGWPLGSRATSWRTAHRFLRDPEGTFDWGVHGRFQEHAALPPDARDTGYRTGDVELWLSPSDPDSAFLRVGDDVERWPRLDSTVGCR
jgi:hypothetical protein